MAAKFNLKSFFINHSEKLVGVVIGVLVLWGFAAASWKPTKIVPGQLVQQANRVRDSINSKSVWPEEERKLFTDTPDVQKLAGELGVRDNLDVERFSTPVVWFEPLNPVREKRGRVIVLAPINPEAEAVSVPLAFPKEPETPEPDKVAAKAKPKEKVDDARSRAADEFGGSSTSQAGGGQAAGGLGAGALAARSLGMMGFSRDERERDRDRRDRDRDRGREAEAAAGSTILATADRDVAWRAGVSVRMIVNLRNQRQKIAEALHITGVQETQQFVDYQQMHVERREYRYGEWSDWETLRLNDIGEILEETLGQDIDIVSPAVTRDGITMPLPRRAAGRWLENQASHQMLVDFSLDEDEQEMMNLLLAKMAADAEEAQKNQPAVRKERRGFSEYTQSVQSLRQGAQTGFGVGIDQWRSDARNQIRSAFEGSDREFGDRQEQILDSQLNRLNGDDPQYTADERLLLVRFFDFTADRGVSYQYRVRLEMYNPNYNVNIDELEVPELRNEETIFSDWSDPTAIVTVPQRYRNYAKKVRTSRLGQQTVTFSVYYESDGVLPVMEDVSVDVGMPVGGGKEKTVRVDLEKQVLEGGEVSVTTNELLGAVIPSVRLNAQDHQDLSETLAGFSRRRNVVDDLVCVIDDSGDIVMRYASEDTAGLQEDRTLVDNILENYSDWDVSENEGGLGLGVDDIEDGGHRRARRSRGMSVGSALSRKPERTSRRDK